MGAAKKVSNYDRETDEWYVEPEWVNRRLFDVEHFEGGIWDPCCGMGRIPEAARAAGHNDVFSTDLIDRGYSNLDAVGDFFTLDAPFSNIVCNPPYAIMQPFAERALKLTTGKVAMVVPSARLHAAWRWLTATPLQTVWLLTPRPSMPPGYVVKYGINSNGSPAKVGGGKADFCWLVWEHGHVAPPTLRWLHRDGEAT